MKNSNKVKYQKIVQKPALFLRAVVRKLVPEAVRPNISTIAKYLCIGLAIRFVLMPITCLPLDATGNFFGAYLIEHYGKYDYFLHYFSTNPPLLNYMLAFFFKIYEFFSPGFFFQKYIVLTPESFPMLLNFISGHPENYPYFEILTSDPNIFSLLFFGKLPSLIFDIATALLLLKIFKNPNKSVLAFKIWMLNPVSIYTIFMMGELEIIPIFFAVYGTYKLYVNKPYAGMFWLGLSIALKPMALLLLPLACFAAAKNKSIVQGVKLLVVGLVPLVAELGFVNAVTLLRGGPQFVTFVDPLYLRNPSPITIWLRTAVDLSAHMSTSSDYTINVIYAFPLIYAIILALSAYSPQIGYKSVWALFTCLFSVLFAFNLFNPHWFLWYVPFALVFILKTGKKLLYIFYALFPLFIVYSFYWWTLQFALFMPLAPTIYKGPSALSLLEQAGLPPILVVNTFRSVLSGFLLFFCILSLKRIYLGDLSIMEAVRNLAKEK